MGLIFILLHQPYLNTLCIKNLRVLDCLEIKSSMSFNLFLLTILFYQAFLLFFSIIDLYFLTPAIPIGITTNEAKAENETHPVIAETKKVNVQCNLTLYKHFYASYS